jgi:hypothetical protein
MNQLGFLFEPAYVSGLYQFVQVPCLEHRTSTLSSAQFQLGVQKTHLERCRY